MNISARAIAVACLMAAGTLWVRPSLADGFVSAATPTAPTAATPTTPAGNALTEAQLDARQVTVALWALVREPGLYTDATVRADALQKAQPMLASLDRDIAEFKMAGPRLRVIVDQTASTADQIRMVLGDPAFVAKVQSDAKSDAFAKSSPAKALLARVEFIYAVRDSAAQNKALDSFEAALKLDPASEDLAKYLALCHTRDTIKEIADRIENILTTDATSSSAKTSLGTWAAQRKLAGLEGNPLVIKSPTMGGAEFSSESLKGQVVLVEFWATWCGPCMRELPHVTEIYKKYHPQGLQLVGITCDDNRDAVVKFLAAHKEVAWTQLFDPQNAGWPAAQQYGVNAIPTLFLIDKKGIVRTVEARQKMDDLIPKLLAE